VTLIFPDIHTLNVTVSRSMLRITVKTDHHVVVAQTTLRITVKTDHHGQPPQTSMFSDATTAGGADSGAAADAMVPVSVVEVPLPAAVVDDKSRREIIG
jgi:hypothetical protein